MKAGHGLATVAASLLALAGLLAAPGARASHGEDVPDGEPGGEAAFGVPCQDGRASGFPCENVDLLARLPLEEFDSVVANDIWGWTDPQSGREIAILGLWQGAAFVDVSEPDRPLHLGTLPTATTPSLWRDIKVYADHAFVVSEAEDHGMQVFDLTRLRSVAAAPEVFEASAHYAGFGHAHNIAVDEESGFAYAVGSDQCEGGLHMVDVREPLHPRFAGCYDGDGYTHDVQCVIYRGPDVEHRGREICFASNEDTLTIVDVTDKAAPFLLSRSGYEGVGYVHQGWLTEDHAWFLHDDELDERFFGHGTRTYVWDLADLDAPILAGDYTADSTATDHNLYVRGDHVFQANYRSGLRVLRLGDPAEVELREVAFFDTVPGSGPPGLAGAWGVYPFFASGVVVVSNIRGGLFVLGPDLAAIPRCADGLDNDRDGLVDYPADPGCAGPDAQAELPRNDVPIAIHPWSGRGRIPPASRAVVAVAVLGRDGFDVREVDGSTLRFGPDGARPIDRIGLHEADVDRDGRPDLVGFYRAGKSGIAPGDARACLAWTARDGTPYEACDAVTTPPSPRGRRR